MPRYRFGGEDAVYVPALIGSTKVVALLAGATGTCWSARSGGTQYTDLQTISGAAITGGQIFSGTNAEQPEFLGPNDITQMWLDWGGGVRFLAEATNLDENLLSLYSALEAHMDEVEAAVAAIGEGPAGADGADGQDGKDGIGILVLASGEAVPAGTPVNTAIFRYPPERTAAGVASTDTFTLTAHGLTDGKAIATMAAGPAPLATKTIYFARDTTANTFKLTASSGGAAVDITANGDLKFRA